jgi:hypothetical protein
MADEMKPLENCMLLGHHLHITPDNYQLRLQILGVGELSTIMTPEEFVVINDVFTRMLADFYFELSKRQFAEPPPPDITVHRIQKDD